MKVKDLTPGSHGHNLVLRVVSVAPTAEKKRYDGSASRIAEAVLADETGCVTFTARNGTCASGLDGCIGCVMTALADLAVLAIMFFLVCVCARRAN